MPEPFSDRLDVCAALRSGVPPLTCGAGRGTSVRRALLACCWVEYARPKGRPPKRSSFGCDEESSSRARVASSYDVLGEDRGARTAGRFNVRRDDRALVRRTHLATDLGAGLGDLQRVAPEVDAAHAQRRRPRTSASRARPRDRPSPGTDWSIASARAFPKFVGASESGFHGRHAAGAVDRGTGSLLTDRSASTAAERIARRRRSRSVRSPARVSIGPSSRRARRMSSWRKRSSGCAADRRNEVLLVHDLVARQRCRSLVDCAPAGTASDHAS